MTAEDKAKEHADKVNGTLEACNRIGSHLEWYCSFNGYAAGYRQAVIDMLNREQEQRASVASKAQSTDEP